MAAKVQAKKKPQPKGKMPPKGTNTDREPAEREDKGRESVSGRILAPIGVKESPKEREARERRRDSLQKILLSKRQEILKEIEESLGQSLTEDQQRRLESARDVGDQALMDLERELGISLMEMRNRRRQSIDEALVRLTEGTYGICAECGIEVSEKRLEAVPFAKLCVECQARQELLEKIEKEEDRD